jgi:hypothetical protein
VSTAGKKEVKNESKIIHSPITLVLSSTNAYAVSWTAGKPMQGGTDKFILTLDGTTITAGALLTGAESAEDKAKAIKKAIDDLNRPELKDKIGIQGGTLTFPGVVKDFMKAKDGDGTKEKDKTASLSPGSGTIGYHNAPSGNGVGGTGSVFQASFGFSLTSTEIFLDSNLTFSGLSNPTIGGLLTDTFNGLLADLPTTFSSNLHLDLANEEIIFDFPSNATNGFVTNFTSDLITQATSGISEVPEPSTLLLFVSGLAGLGVSAWRRPDQKLKERLT